VPRHSRPYLEGEHAAVELVELDGEPAAHTRRTSASYHPHTATRGPAAHSVHAFRTPAHGDDSSYHDLELSSRSMSLELSMGSSQTRRRRTSSP
jgi:hypothetical protein